MMAGWRQDSSWQRRISSSKATGVPINFAFLIALEITLKYWSILAWVCPTIKNAISISSKENDSTRRLYYAKISLFLLSPQLSYCNQSVRGTNKDRCRSSMLTSIKACRVISIVIFAPPLISSSVRYTSTVLMGPHTTPIPTILVSMCLSPMC